MAGTCQLCGKTATFGNNVSHSKRHTSRRWAANIQKTQVLVGNEPVSVHLCTRCMRTMAKKRD
ncbi:MAG: 50S ribosomal protein L28 [Chloroflexi bacterium]|nr:50S ribosomal protein L28 [Chloroflexota bacterium]MCL5108494.1 50S ribosomal protein L28 [Chloroflexota bacterium]